MLVADQGVGPGCDDHGDLDISGDGTTLIRSTGPAQKVTINGVGQDRVSNSAGFFLKMRDLTLANGAAKGSGVEDGGGAVRVLSGCFRVRGMLFVSNRSESDGGAVLLSESASSIGNSTISGNTADGPGGGIADSAPTSEYSGGTFHNVTVACSKADLDQDGTGHGGGLAISGPNSVVFAINPVLALNRDLSPTPASRAPDCFAPVSGLSPMYLMSTQALGTSKCPVLPDGAYIRHFSPVDPKLRSLAENGGPTRTHAIGPGSPAAGANRILNSQNELMCVARDQRGKPRAPGIYGLGAFQVNGAIPPVRRISTRTALDPGSKLLLLLCPARVRPARRSVVSVLIGGRRGRTVASRTIRVPSGQSRAAMLDVRRPFWRRLAALTHSSGRKVLVRQRIRGARLGSKPMKTWITTFGSYRVRAFERGADKR